MDSLELLKAKVNIHTTTLKLKASIEDLKQNNPHRNDLIVSMIESLNDVEQFENVFRELEELYYQECKINLRHQMHIADLKHEVDRYKLANKIKKEGF